MRMRPGRTLRRRIVAAAAVMTLSAVVACEAEEDGTVGGAAAPGADASAADPHQGVDPAAPVREGELPEPGPIDLSELGEDARGLALGDEHVIGGNHTTIVEVRRPLPVAGDSPRPGPGKEWVGVRVETCFETELDRQLEIGSYMFSAVTDDGFAYPGVQPRDPRWPLPQYPGYGRLAAGQCTSGWVAVPVPVGVPASSVVQSSVTKQPVSQWTVPPGAW